MNKETNNNNISYRTYIQFTIEYMGAVRQQQKICSYE